MNKRWAQRFTSSASTAIIVGLLTAILCFCLYQWDNKYTAPGSQPISGILYLTEEELEEIPVHYLIREWRFYPGKLLKPEDLDDSRDELYSRYIYVGQYGGMELDSTLSKPRGSGTYRLTLCLPDTEHTYSIKMPQVYSSYQLYVNDDLLLQMGDPDPKHYQEALQERIVTFRGKGYVELLIAVTDKDGFYSGMVYPPALGLSLPVSQMEAVRQILFTAVELFALIVLVVSVYLAVRSGQMVDIWVIPLAMCLMGYLAYPLSRLFFALPNDPWRFLANLCFYGFFVALVWVYSINYRWKDGWSVLMKVIAVVVLAGGCITTFLSSFCDESAQLYRLSSLADILRWMIIGNTIYLTWRTIRENREYGKLLSAGGSILSICLLADQLLPMHEPICSGWYPEVGMMLFLVILGFTELTDVAGAYRFRLTYDERARQTERLLALEKAHYISLQEKIEEARKARHDLRQHLYAAQSMLHRGETEELRRYLEQYAAAEHPRLSRPVRFCQLQAVDAILSYYWDKARQQNVEFEFAGQIPALAEDISVELCALLGNLLENALEATARQKSGERFMRISARQSQNKLIFQVVNSCNGTADRKGNYFYSSKRKDETGIGTHSIQVIAQKHNGYANFISEENIFTAQVVLSL